VKHVFEIVARTQVVIYTDDDEFPDEGDAAEYAMDEAYDMAFDYIDRLSRSDIEITLL